MWCRGKVYFTLPITYLWMNETDKSDQGSVNIVGTVHVSQSSSDKVKRTIKEEQPDIVAIELDPKRYEKFMEKTFSDGENIQKTTFKDALFNEKIKLPKYLLLRSIMTVQSRLSAKTGIEPDDTDMQAALKTAVDENIPIALIDRSPDRTIERLFNEITISGTLSLILYFIISLLSTPFITSDTIESLDSHEEKIKETIQGLEKEMPSFYKAFIHERDVYMSHALKKLSIENDVVAIVGLGHKNGISECLSADETEFGDERRKLGITGYAYVIELEESTS